MKETDLERKKLERGQKFFFGFLGIIFLIVGGTLITGHFQRQYLKNNPRSVILTKEDPMDNRKIRTLLLPSKSNYSTSINFNNDAKLYFRCTGSYPEVFLATNRVMSNGRIRLKWDEGEVEYSAWNISNTRQALFNPDPKKFVSKVLTHEKLMISFTPFYANEEFSEFRLNNEKGIYTVSFRDDLKTMKSYCF